MYDDLHKLLKLGEIEQVQQHLEMINVAKVSRDSVLPLANIARRAGFHRLAFRIVNPVVRPRNKLRDSPASPEELCEYAMILFRLGVLGEARNILTSSAVQNCPERFLYLAFIYFSEWDYERASNLLESYIGIPNIDGYQKASAKINLAQSYIVLGKTEKAIDISNEVIAEAKGENWRLVHANALQNLADANLDKKDFAKIPPILEEIQKLIGDSHYRYNLYMKRVQACSHLPDTKLIHALADEAFQKRHYELFRECNFIEAVAKQNEELFRKVYFGTPYPEYRKRILRVWNRPIDLGEFYLWDLNPQKISSEVFDVLNARVEGESAQVKMGTAIHRLITLFSENLYRTFKAEALFSLLFPDEFLQPTISTTKVHQIVSRTRRWLEANHIGFTIAEDRGDYFLTSAQGCKLKIPLEGYKPKSVGDQHLSRLREVIGENIYFTARNVKDALSIATASANRLLKKAVEEGDIIKLGQGKSTEYIFSSNTNKNSQKVS